MTTATGEWETDRAAGQATNVSSTESWSVPRWNKLFLLFLFPVFFCGMSWMMGGIPALTDAGFVTLVMISLGMIIRELILFPRRFGIGGLLLYIGCIGWFGYDYIVHWMGVDFRATNQTFITRAVVAKAAFYHCLFMAFATIGLTMPAPKRSLRIMTRLPEAKVVSAYLLVIAICFVVGTLPYFAFVRGSGIKAILNSMISGRTDLVQWTVGRTGNANYSWGGYLAYTLLTGQVGAQLALFYAMIISRNLIAKAFCWSYWLLYVGFAFGSGTRGQVAFMFMPLCILIYLKHQLIAASLLQKISLKAYIFSGFTVLALLALFQTQIRYRNVGFQDLSIKDVSMTEIEGNAMFSEGLNGWAVIPDSGGNYLTNDFFGAGLIMPLPDTLWRFVLGGIPRTLWPNKPFDRLGAWYNHIVSGRDINDPEGTTFATGLVGDWYFRYGILGVIQGAILFGWLCRLFELSLLGNLQRPFGLLVSVGMGVCIFRFFRNFTPVTFYPLFIPVVVMSFMIIFINLFISRPAEG